MAGRADSHFLVLPDVAAPPGVTGLAPVLASHPSGRPWILGSLPADQIKTVAVGERRLAVLGRSAESSLELETTLAKVEHTTGLDAIGRLAGSHHLLVSVNGRTRIRGDISGMRRVFHARIGGLVLASDRSDVLAELLGVDPDPSLLVLRLLDALPHSLGERSVWPGVSAVPAGHCLDLTHDGRTSGEVRWWSPPEPDRPLAEGAADLRVRLTRAVEIRTRSVPHLSADLSGGLDSTPLCFLAARGPARLTTMTMVSDDPIDDDPYWAGLAARAMPNVDHLSYPEKELPSFYGDLLQGARYADEPSMSSLSAARVIYRLGIAQSHGSSLHLDGLGGDQVLTGTPVHYHDLLRRRPLRALRRLRRHQLVEAFPVTAAVRGLSGSGTYRHWLAAVRRGFSEGRPVGQGALFSWETPPRLTPWLTAAGREEIIKHFAETADSAQPLAAHRGRHADLSAILGAGRAVRLLHQHALAGGPRAESPFLDDQVVESCLRVRPEERLTPYEYKPLMKAAMRGVVPAEILLRRSNADGTTLAAEGFAAHRAELTELWHGSRLAELGLIRTEPLIELTTRTYSGQLHDWSMETTLATELWLRSHDHTSLSGGRR